MNYGWQEVFWITGALGFVWLLFWLILYDVPMKQRRITAGELKLITEDHDTEDSSSTTRSVKWYKLFTFPQTWAFVTGKFLIDPIYWFFLFWLPSYFSSTFNLDLTKPSLQLMIIYAATTVGSVSGGYLSSRLIRKGWPTLNARKNCAPHRRCIAVYSSRNGPATHPRCTLGTTSQECNFCTLH